MGLQGDAAIVGIAEVRPLRHYEEPPKFNVGMRVKPHFDDIDGGVSILRYEPD